MARPNPAWMSIARPAVSKAAKAICRVSASAMPISSSAVAVRKSPRDQKSICQVCCGWPATSQAASAIASIIRTIAGIRSRVKGGAKARAGAIRRLTSKAATAWSVSCSMPLRLRRPAHPARVGMSR